MYNLELTVLCTVMNASSQEPSESRMALKFSHKINKDVKQNCWESRRSSTAWGSRVSWAEQLPGSGLLPGEPCLYEYPFKDSKARGSFTTHLLFMDLGQGGTELPGRHLVLNNKTPISPYEGGHKELPPHFYRRKGPPPIWWIVLHQSPDIWSWHRFWNFPVAFFTFSKRICVKTF